MKTPCSTPNVIAISVAASLVMLACTSGPSKITDVAARPVVTVEDSAESRTEGRADGRDGAKVRGTVDPKLHAGCQVSGVTLLQGKPTKGVIVTFGGAGSSKKRGTISAQAVSDRNGRYSLPKLLPPGKYDVRARSRQGDPFAALLQMRFKTVLVIRPGEKRRSYTVVVMPVERSRL